MSETATLEKPALEQEHLDEINRFWEFMSHQGVPDPLLYLFIKDEEGEALSARDLRRLKYNFENSIDPNFPELVKSIKQLWNFLANHGVEKQTAIRMFHDKAGNLHATEHLERTLAEITAAPEKLKRFVATINKIHGQTP